MVVVHPASLCTRAFAMTFSTARVSSRSSPNTMASAAASGHRQFQGMELVEAAVHVFRHDAAKTCDMDTLKVKGLHVIV